MPFVLQDLIPEQLEEENHRETGKSGILGKCLLTSVCKYVYEYNMSVNMLGDNFCQLLDLHSCLVPYRSGAIVLQG